MKKTALGFLFFVLLFSAIATVPSANAWGPNTHVYLLKDILTVLPTTNEAYKFWQIHPDAMLCGLMFPDVTVIYYYLDFKQYQSTHSWNWLERLWATAGTDRERAFVWGVAFHLVQDSISHNEYIPKKIRETNVLNGIIHPLVEASVEASYVMFETASAMEAVDEFLPFVQRTLGKDMTREAHLFRDIIRSGSFYEEGYAPPKDDLKWQIYRGLLNFAQARIDSSDHLPYLTRAREFSVAYAQLRLPTLYDPSGAVSLGQADSELTFSSVLIYLVLGTVIIVVIWRFRR